MGSAKSQLAILAFAILGASACSDSTGPIDLDPASALQSLALGLPDAGGYGDALVGSLLIRESLGGLSPFVGRAAVTVDGAWQPMYALAMHIDFAPGTCRQTIFPMGPHDTGCTQPYLGVGIALWQSRSANAPPDRLIVLLTDVGGSDFGLFPDLGGHSGYALYAGDNLRGLYESGTATTSVTQATAPCGTPLPTFAKTGACNTATFDVDGTITFAMDTDNCCVTQTVTIPRQSIPGLWMAISEVKPSF